MEMTSQKKSSSGGLIRGKLLAKSLFGLGSKSSKSRTTEVVHHHHHHHQKVVNGGGGFYYANRQSSDEVANNNPAAAAAIQKSSGGKANNTSSSLFYRDYNYCSNAPGDANVDAKAATYISYVRNRFMAERLDSEAW